MKHTRYPIIILALLLAVIVSSCADKTVRIFTANVPTFQSVEDFRATTFQMEAARPLEHPGKIYIYNNLLLVNELFAGVHFFDNSNPASPQAIGFLPIFANTDMGIRNGQLYVDNYYDLLTFDINNPQQPALVSRVENVFTFDLTYMLPGYDDAFPMSPEVDYSQGIVLSWTQEKVETESDYYMTFDRGGVFTTMDATLGGTSESFIGGTGMAGSTARFAIVDDHLYTVEGFVMDVFDLSGEKRVVTTINLSRNAETIFPQGGRLYIGTTTGMLIFDLSNLDLPVQVGDYSHFTACDPVVVDGNLAYVTLRTGTRCFGDLNVLEVIDISNVSNPTLLYTYQMESPRGLGVDANLLFLCDGPAGLKVFDRTDPAAITANEIATFGDISANDVIPFNDILLMTSEQGIYQYSYADPNAVSLLSLIPVQR